MRKYVLRIMQASVRVCACVWVSSNWVALLFVNALWISMDFFMRQWHLCSRSFRIRFDWKKIMACMLTLISPTVWFGHSESSRSLTCSHTPYGDQTEAKGASKYVCPVMDFCGRAMISFFSSVSLSSDFRFHYTHTHAFPKCCPNRNLFCFSVLFWFLIIPKSIRIFFSVARSRLVSTIQAVLV